MSNPPVGISVPPILEESRETTPVVPRRNSEGLTPKLSKQSKIDRAENADSNMKCSKPDVLIDKPDVLKSENKERQYGKAEEFNKTLDEKNGKSLVKPAIKVIDEGLAQRRRSFVPMSSMEEENLRERLHLAQLRQCSAIVYNEVRYTKDSFRRMFMSKV